MRRVIAALAALALWPASAAAQQREGLDRRLDPATLAAVRAIVDSARLDSLPAGALEDKALEGTAKHVPAARVLDAVRRLAGELRSARGLLRTAAPAATVSDAEVVAAADAIRRGSPAAEVATLRGQVPADASLVVAFTVLGDLVQRGVPATQAREVIQQLVGSGVPPQQIAEIPPRMDVALRVGAPPVDALRSALPIPLRPTVPQHPTGRPRP